MPSNTAVPYCSACVAMEIFASARGTNAPSKYAIVLSAISCEAVATSWCRCSTVLGMATPPAMKKPPVLGRLSRCWTSCALAARPSPSSSRQEPAEDDRRGGCAPEVDGGSAPLAPPDAHQSTHRSRTLGEGERAVKNARAQMRAMTSPRCHARRAGIRGCQRDRARQHDRQDHAHKRAEHDVEVPDRRGEERHEGAVLLLRREGRGDEGHARERGEEHALRRERHERKVAARPERDAAVREDEEHRDDDEDGHPQE